MIHVHVEAAKNIKSAAENKWMGKSTDPLPHLVKEVGNSFFKRR